MCQKAFNLCMLSTCRPLCKARLVKHRSPVQIPRAAARFDLKTPRNSSSASIRNTGVLARASSTVAEEIDTQSQPAQDAPAHIPVLLNEVLKDFQSVDLKVHVDCTLGAGGHASALLEAHPEMQHFIGIDRDPSALELAKASLQRYQDRGTKLHFVHGNFRDLESHLRTLGFSSVDGILMDLGVSSMQLDQRERGFNREEGPLDMRMDTSATGGLSAAVAVNSWTEQRLGQVIRDYGQERRWKAIAQRIVEARQSGPIETTDALRRAIGGSEYARIRPWTLTFQALRMAVNDELSAVEAVVPAAVRALRTRGRVAIISYNQMEDCIVDWHLKGASRRGHTDKQTAVGRETGMEPRVRLMRRRVLRPLGEEMRRNRRSRNGKLRVAERL